MDRRIAGLLVVVLALLVAVVTGGLQVRTVSGTPAVGRIPVPPHLGECLLENPPDAALLITAGTAYRLGNCSVPHYGEVAEVVPDAMNGVHTPTGLAYPIKPCGDESSYLGWHVTSKARPAIRWRPIDLTVISMAPTPLQSAFGQKWAVCVVTPVEPGASYSGSIQNALSTGRLPVSFAQCLVSAQTPTDTISCDQPHRYEVFGSALLPDGDRDQSALDTDCRAIVASTTHMPDITVGGALTVAARPFHWGTDGLETAGWPQGSQSGEVMCTVAPTAARLLTGTLFGLGQHPPHWA